MALNVLILAAGFGTRLNAIGETLPKGLIPYKTTTLLGRMLTQIGALNCQIALVTNNRFFTTYRDYLAKSFPDLKVKVLNNGIDIPEKRLGAIADLQAALTKLQWTTQDVLVLPSDTFFTFQIRDLLAFYEAHHGFTTVFRELPDASAIAGRLGCGVLSGDRVIKFVEKPAVPPSHFAAVPLYIYPKELLSKISDYIASGGNLDSPGQIVGWLIDKGIWVYGYTYQGDYLDVGTPTDITTLTKL